MNELMVIKHKGERVITTSLLAEVYGTEPNNIKTNFNRNKDNFVEGKHYFLLQGKELAGFKRLVTDSNPALADSLKFVPQLYLWTERGANRHCKILDTDKAWEQFDNLEEIYFKVKEVVNAELSPELQMLQGLLNQMVQKELADKERDMQIAQAKEMADKAVETTERIKDAVRPVFDNWRVEINAKFKRIQHYCDIPFKVLRNDMYTELEHRAGCDLNTRLRNLKKRLYESGAAKTEINNCRKIDVIEKDKKLREIFSKIVSEYEIQYCA